VVKTALSRSSLLAWVRRIHHSENDSPPPARGGAGGGGQTENACISKNGSRGGAEDKEQHPRMGRACNSNSAAGTTRLVEVRLWLRD
jgi:hypothetical protein